MQRLITKNGYSLFEVSSAFQKSVRRGLENDALHWATELLHSNFDEYLWRRMRIMSSEDIGLAKPISAEVYALYQMYELQKKHSKGEQKGIPPEHIFAYHCVLLLVRSPKSRLVDNVLMYHESCHEQNRKRPIPDYAFDKHTSRGKFLGRGFKHFFEEGAQLENKVDLEGDAEYERLAFEAMTAEQIAKKASPDQNQIF